MARKQLGVAPSNSLDIATKGYVDGITGVDGVEITSLSTITGSELAADDVFLVIDVSDTSGSTSGTAKIIEKSEMASVMGGGVTSIDGGDPASTYTVSLDGGNP